LYSVRAIAHGSHLLNFVEVRLKVFCCNIFSHCSSGTIPHHELKAPESHTRRGFSCPNADSWYHAAASESDVVLWGIEDIPTVRTQVRGLIAAGALLLVVAAALFAQGRASSSSQKFAYHGGSMQGRSLDASLFGPDLKFRSKDYTTGTNPQSIQVGDFNEDGKLDVVMVDYSGGGAGSVSVFLGNGDGTFQAKTDYATGDGPDSVVVADLNGDGHLDLAVADDTGTAVSVLLGNGDGTFQAHKDYAAGSFPHWVAVGDFNGDKALDLAVTNEGDNTVGVLLNNGDGTFQAMKTYATAVEPYSVAVADFNQDGFADLAVTGYYASVVSILLGEGNGKFKNHVDYDTGTAPAALIVGDFNGDGYVDLVTANYNNGNTGSASVLLGKGDGTFGSHKDFTSGTGPDGVAAGDLDGDGIPDLIVANLIGDSISVLLGKGDGTFGTPTDFNTGKYPIGIAVGAYSGQVAGSADLAVTNDLSTSMSVFLNLAATRITLASSPNPSKHGQPVTFTVTVTSALKRKAAPTGSVTFKDGSKKLGSVKMANGTAKFTTSKLSAGNHQITANYSGDSQFNPGISAVLVQKVKP
jgi:hypothetical protein